MCNIGYVKENTRESISIRENIKKSIKKNIKRLWQKACCNLRIRAAAVGALALAWWGLLYPELCFTENTCVKLVTAQGQELMEKEKDRLELEMEVMSATGDEIIIRSRLLEWLEQKRQVKVGKSK